MQYNEVTWVFALRRPLGKSVATHYIYHLIHRWQCNNDWREPSNETCEYHDILRQQSG